jgi:hypothetical protein
VPQIVQQVVTVVVPATPVPTPVPTAVAVVAGVQALPRTGSGDVASGANYALLLIGVSMFAASAGVAGLAWRSSKSA